MTAHTSSIPDTTSKLRRCRVCGFTGLTVSKGLFVTKAGKYVAIDRCLDRLACDSRKAAL